MSTSNRFAGAGKHRSSNKPVEGVMHFIEQAGDHELWVQRGEYFDIYNHDSWCPWITPLPPCKSRQEAIAIWYGRLRAGVMDV